MNDLSFFKIDLSETKITNKGIVALTEILKTLKNVNSIGLKANSTEAEKLCGNKIFTLLLSDKKWVYHEVREVWEISE